MQAIDSLNGQTMNGGLKLYVSRAQKKKERQQELMRKHEAEKMERYNRYGTGKVVMSVALMG